MSDTQPIYKIDCLHKMPWGDVRINLFANLDGRSNETTDLEKATEAFNYYAKHGKHLAVRLVKYTPEVLEENE